MPKSLARRQVGVTCGNSSVQQSKYTSLSTIRKSAGSTFSVNCKIKAHGRRSRSVENLESCRDVAAAKCNKHPETTGIKKQLNIRNVSSYSDSLQRNVLKHSRSDPCQKRDILSLSPSKTSCKGKALTTRHRESVCCDRQVADEDDETLRDITEEDASFALEEQQLRHEIVKERRRSADAITKGFELNQLSDMNVGGVIQFIVILSF
ncbi:unnamed protein product [Soboliphyme baturini]|uniref:SENP7 n=1 Tax=Soboliphyme baturini TaxID=241478 RepID=A0A183IMG9_9BILA|nr:unnamed protein product [Soboliphyme baturini]